MSENKVLVPIDGSEFSLQIVPYVKRFLAPADNELVLLRVGEEPEVVHIERPGFEDLTVYVDQIETSLEEKFLEEAQSYINDLQDAGFKVTFEVRFGKPAQEIEQFIESEGIDLVAMTTHGRTGLSRVMLGSVAAHLLHHVTVPIILYRPLARRIADAFLTETSGELREAL